MDRNQFKTRSILTCLAAVLAACLLAAVPLACLAVAAPTVTLRVPSTDLPKLSRVRILSRIDYGAFSVVEVPSSTVAGLRAVKARVQEEKAARIVGIQGRAFDVRDGVVAPVAGMTATAVAGSPTLYIVHFAGPTKKEWLARIEKAGGRIVTYVPNNSYLVWIDPVRVSALNSSTFVSWKGLYQPVHKIARTLDSAKGIISFLSVLIYDDSSGVTIGKIKALGARFVRSIDSPIANGVPAQSVIFSCNASIIPAIAKLPRVVRIDRFSTTPGLDDEVAAQVVAGNRLNGIPYANPPYRSWLQQFGIDGTGSRIAIVDTGCDTNNDATAHQDLAGRLSAVVLYNLGTSTDIIGHGTHVAGVAAGSGAGLTVDDEGFLYGQGVAPGSTLVIQNALSSSLFPPSGSWARLTTDSVANGAFVSNNSWRSSDTLGLGYTTICSAFDSLVRDGNPSEPGVQPLIMVFSTGNVGPDMSTIQEPKEAKNIITVGSSENYRRPGPLNNTCGLSDDIDGVATFSSRGPCADGRLAPTLVAPGTNTASSASSSSPYSGGCQSLISPASPKYAWMSGTSVSAPMVSGAVALVGQWWRAAHSGANPSPAMAKAILINGADDMAGGPDGRGGTLDHIPSGDQGWGRLNIGACIGPSGTFYDDQSYVFTETGQSRSYRVHVVDPAKPLKITLVWSDAPGAPGADAWANDLDLAVTNDSSTYLGNVFQNGASIIGGERDYKNNVECVYLQNASGTYTVNIIAANIAADGVPSNGNPLDQDYALVIRNGTVGGTNLDPYVPVASAVAPLPDEYKAALPIGGWSAVGLRPSTDSDRDLQLYSDSAYETLAASSTIRGSGVEIVAVDGNHLSAGNVYPVAQSFSGTGGYQIEWATHTTDLAPGVADARSFGVNEVLRTWDVDMSAPGPCGLLVHVSDPTLDVGVSVFASTDGVSASYYQGKGQALAEADSEGAGGDELLLFQAPSAGRYAVVVWCKAGSGSYSVLADTTPPTDPVVTPESRVTAVLSHLSASWSASDPESGVVRYEYCIGTTSGGTDVVSWTDVGAATNVSRDDLALTAGTEYFFSVRATNGVTMTSQGSSLPVLAVEALADIPAAKAKPDDSAIQLTGKPVTAAFSGRFYIQEPDNLSGIGVIWAGDVTEGTTVTVAGRMKLVDGERFIEAVDVK